MTTSRVLIARDGSRLRPHAQAAISELLEVIALAPPRVRRMVSVRWRRGEVYLAAGDIELRVRMLDEQLDIHVTSAPAGDARRRLLREARACHRLESSWWLAWVLDVLASDGPRWLSWREHVRSIRGADGAGKAA